jgi:osmotically-inducible protein OsmY
MKSDTEIQRDVQNEMQWDPSLDESAIGVKVQDGVVTLVGVFRIMRTVGPRKTSRNV